MITQSNCVHSITVRPLTCCFGPGNGSNQADQSSPTFETRASRGDRQRTLCTATFITTRSVLYLAWVVGLVLGTGPLQSQGITSSWPTLDLADRWIEDAQLQDVNSEGQLSYQTQAGIESIELGRVVRWERGRPARRSSLLWLGDGTWLAGELDWPSSERVRLKSDWFQPVQFELSELRGIIFKPPLDSVDFAELQRRMSSVSGADDVVWNRKSEELTGVLSLRMRASPNASLPLVASWSLQPTGAVESTPLNLDSLQAIVLSPVLRAPLAPVEHPVMIELTDGSQLMHVHALERKADGSVSILLADQSRLQSIDSASEFVESCVRIQGEPEGVVWLSTVTPARYRFLSEQSILAWPLGRDQDLFGRAISVGRQPVARGLTIHAPAQVAYRWDGSPAKFLAEVSLLALDSDLSPLPGSADCKVLVARDGALVEVCKTPTLRAPSPAVRVQVDLTGAQLLVLIVEESDQGTVGDHVLWREPRIVQPKKNSSR